MDEGFVPPSKLVDDVGQRGIVPAVIRNYVDKQNRRLCHENGNRTDDVTGGATRPCACHQCAPR